MKSIAVCSAVVGIALGSLTAKAAVALPEGYTPLEWIGSTGVQWIDTGYTPKATTIVETRVFAHKKQADSGWSTVFGAQSEAGGAYDRTYSFTVKASGKFGYIRYRRSSGNEFAEPDFYERVMDVTCNGKSMTYEPVDKSFAAKSVTLTSDPKDSECSIFLFAVNKEGVSGDSGAVRIYSFSIREGEATMLDLVPCRSSDGEAGFWDRVAGRFFGNDGNGTLRASDDIPVFLSRMSVPNKSYIDTGFKPNQDTRVKMDVGVNATRAYWFGAWNVAYNDGAYAIGNDNSSVYIGYDGQGGGQGKILANGRHTIDFNKNEASLDDETRKTFEYKAFQLDYNLYLFLQNRAGEPYAPTTGTTIDFYTCQVWDDVTLVRDFRPCLDTDGFIGVTNVLENGLFYSNAKDDDGHFTAAGIGYLTNGDVLIACEGELTADCLQGYTALEKNSWQELNASAVTEYTIPLTLAKGTFSLADGVATAYTADSLTLDGGAILAIDLLADGCDMITATTLAISATAENPVRIKLVSSGLLDIPVDAVYPFLSGVTADDLPKFKLLTDLPAALAVRNGALAIVAEVPEEDYVRTAAWLGAAGDDLADPENWLCSNLTGVVVGELPSDKTVVTLPDGSSFSCTNGAPFTCRQLNLPATLGGDSDLRGVTAPLVGTVDLKGHKLYLTEANGTATFTGGEYQILESLRAPKGAYIDTGYTPDQDTLTRMRLTVGGTSESWFGCGGNESTWWQDCAYALANDGTGIYVGHHKSSATIKTIGILPVGWTGVVELDKNVANFYKDDAAEPTDSITVNAQTFKAVNTMWLFADNEEFNVNYQIKAYNNVLFYGCRIWSGDGTLVRDYVPAMRLSDGVVGLIDRANGNEFKPSASATAFVAVGNPREAADGGEVHFDIPANQTKTNSGLLFKGNVKVVKDGEGTLVATKTGQTYAGGTVVAAGTLKAQNAAYPCRSTNDVVTIMAGATLDSCQTTWTDGVSAMCLYRLAGGTIANTGTQGTGSSDACQGLGYVELTDDSSISTTRRFGFMNFRTNETYLAMNGHTLTVDTGSATFQFFNTTVTGGGKIRVVRASTVDLAVGALQAAGTELDTNARVNPYDTADHLIGSLTVRSSAVEAGGYFTGLKVADTYRPVADGIVGNVVLLDGVTIDLSERTTPLAGSPENGLSFEENATVYVLLGDRKVRSSEPLITWSAKPESVKFCLTSGATGWLEAKDGGLYRYIGFGIIIR